MSNSEMQQVQLSGGLELQNKLLAKLDKANEEFGQGFTPYGTQCVINAIAGLVIHCKANGINTKDLDQSLTLLALQNIGYTELNIAAIPSECFIETRSMWVDGVQKYSVAIRPQGNGNEKLVRLYGVDLKTLGTALLIREGDEWELPGFDGFKRTSFKWISKSLDSKVVMVVYPIIKTDDSVDYLIATRESVKANIVAHIRNNTLYEFKKLDKEGKPVKENGKPVIDIKARDDFYESLNAYAEKHTVDELLACEDFREYISPAYISYGSKESMMIRKMKNNALKPYPREFANSFIKNAVERMFEDVDESLNEDSKVVVTVDPVEKVEEEIKEAPKGEPVPDFEVKEKETPKVKAAGKEEKSEEPAPTEKDYGF